MTPSDGVRAEPPGARPAVGDDERAEERGEEREVGVGPWPGGPDAWPRVPDLGGPPGATRLDPRYDPELLAHGDRRNVVDAYRYWTVEAVVADLDARRDPARSLHVAIENWAHDLNIGSVVRTANAFNAAGVHVVGRRRWNRRGAMVTDRYLHVHHHASVDDLATWAAGEGLPLLGVDNLPGSVPIEGYALPASCVLLLGQESTGLTPEAVAACRDVLHITQHGSTRSINAGAAGAIALHAWAARHLAPAGGAR
ncbi:tRNA G18 (ribose-2'-O)-methylase SpoU [Cellulosimicrobium cellulans]|jgi:tRNA G18 (ribose-2'-O)-methylase SpoU|uniref:RNA methyltransferase n=1 Tax=Cellulosimicrobium cellulans TaxID=1710 RepID=A0A1Y0I0N2_CELCE|nr:RNA methyltransferase [Cellulosimicrobium cellulans]ARU53820.1 RNA methyltransferase [Cellulosimicrobium cellulans]MBM7818428.1 tRNA G18 (ribose-2'-O)-methylase SpoU [Cellulosimicrobium cellulans]